MRIKLGSAYSKITDLKENDDLVLADIESVLTVHPANYFFDPMFKSHKWDGYVHFLDKRGNRFPTGLLNKVIEVAATSPLSVDDERKVNWFDIKNLPDEIRLSSKDSSIVLRDYQYAAVKESLTKHRGLINIAVTGGKTSVAVAIIQQLLTSMPENQRIIFFTHNKEIFSQTLDTFHKFLHVTIGEVGSGTWKPAKVTVAMLPTLSRHLQKPTAKDVELTGEYQIIKFITDTIRPSISQSKLTQIIGVLQSSRKKSSQEVADVLVHIVVNHKDLRQELKAMKKELKKFIDKSLEKQMAKYSQAMDFLNSAYCMITDEVQHASAKSYYKVLMSCSAPYRFGLSGTLDSDEIEKVNFMRIKACTGEIIYKISSDFLIKHGYSAKPTVYFEEINQPILHPKLSWQAAYRHGIEENEYRNQIIVNRVTEKYKAQESCLIIVNHIAHGEILDKLLHRNGVISDFTNGQLSNETREELLKKMKDGSLRVLIATNILDEGVNVVGLNNIFIASGGKSYRQVIQRVGRGLRIGENKRTVEIYDYLDYTQPILLKHTKERFSYYKNERFTIKHARRNNL